MEFHLHTRFHITGCIGSLIVAIRQRAKYRFHVATTLLFYLMQNYYLPFFEMYSQVSFQDTTSGASVASTSFIMSAMLLPAVEN
jgi:hypothetical protein